MVKCCKYAPFGCTVTRTKASGIKAHQKICQYKRFEIYLQAMEENKKLKQQIFELRMARPKQGRPEIPVASVDFRDFKKMLMDDIELVRKWRILAGNPRNGVKAMVVLFVNAMPRFYKLRNLTEIDVNCRLPTLRTFGKLERHRMVDLVDGLFSASQSCIEDIFEYLDFGKSVDEYRFRDVVPFDKSFVYNCLSEASKRKRGGMIRFDGRSVFGLENSDTLTL